MLKRSTLLLMSLAFVLFVFMLPVFAQEMRIVTAQQNANVRQRASTSAAAVGSLAIGESAVVIGEDAAGENVSGIRLWYQVRLTNGAEGWVWAGIVTLAEVTPTPSPTPRPTLTPNPNYEVITVENLHQTSLIQQWGIGVPYYVAWSPVSNLVAVGAQNNILFYDPEDWSLIRRISDETLFSPTWLGTPIFQFVGETLVTAFQTYERGTQYSLRLYHPDAMYPQSISLNAPITGIASHPDGVHMAIGLGDTSLAIYNVETRQRVEVLIQGHIPDRPIRDNFQALAYSADGRHLARIYQGQLTLYQSETPEQYTLLREFTITLSPGESVFNPSKIAFTPDGTQIIAVGSFQDTRFIDVETGTRANINTGRQIGRTEIDPDGHYIAMGGGYLYLMDQETRTFLPDLPSIEVGDLALSPDGQKLVVVNDDTGLLEVYSVPALQIEHTLELSTTYNDADLSLDGQVLAVTSGVLDRVHGSRIDLYQPSLDTQLPYASISLGSNDIIHQLAISPDSTRLAVGGMTRQEGSYTNWLRVLHLPDGAVLQEYSLGYRELDTIFRGYFSDIVWQPEGQTIASASIDGLLRLWDSATLQVRAAITPANIWLGDLDYSPDGRLLAVSTRSNQLFLYDAQGRLQRTITSSTWNRLSGTAFSPDGETLLTLGHYEPPCNYSSCSPIPAGTHLESTLERWNVQTGERLTGYQFTPPADGQPSPLIRFGFSLDGSFLFAGDGLGRSAFFGALSGARLARRNVQYNFNGDDTQSSQVFFTQDGTAMIAVNSPEGVIQLYGIPKEAAVPAYFEDDFENGSLRAWENHQRIQSIVQEGNNHFLRLENDTGNYSIVALRNGSWSNYALEAKIRVQQAAVVFLNVRESTRGSYAAVLDVGGQAVSLITGINGRYTDLGSQWSDLTVGEWIPVRVEVWQNQIRLYLSDRLVLFANNDVHTEGGVSFTVGDRGIVEFDDIRIMQLAEVETLTPTSTPTATSTVTPLPSNTPTPTATFTLTPTPTLTPQPSNTPTLAATATPVEIIRFQDDFETSDLQTWADWDGIGQIINDNGNHILRLENDSDAFAIFSLLDHQWIDYAVEVSVRIEQSTPEQTDFFLNVRETDAGGYVGSLDIESAAVGLIAGQNGTYPTLGAASAPVNLHQWIRLRIELQGEEIKVFVNDVQQINVANNYHTQGGVSFTVGPHTIVEIDDVQVFEGVIE